MLSHWQNMRNCLLAQFNSVTDHSQSPLTEHPDPGNGGLSGVFGSVIFVCALLLNDITVLASDPGSLPVCVRRRDHQQLPSLRTPGGGLAPQGGEQVLLPA